MRCCGFSSGVSNLNFMKRNYFDLIILFFLVICLVSSCAKNKSLDETKYPIHLEWKEDISFSLDSLTDGYPKNKTAIFRSNNPNDSIFDFNRDYLLHVSLVPGYPYFLFYDLGDQSLFKKLEIDMERMNISTYLGDVIILNSDSLYIQNFPFLTLFSLKGEAIKRYSLISRDKTAEILPFLETALVNGNFYSGYLGNELPPAAGNSELTTSQMNGAILKLDLSLDSVLFVGELPVDYQNNNFFPYHHYFASLTTNEDSSKIIYSFGASNYIQALDLSNNTTQNFPALSDLFEKVPSKLSASDDMDDFDFYRLHHSFERIIFDPYRKVYYRFYSFPKTEEELNNPAAHISRLKSKLGVVILDEKFQKIGETILPVGYNSTLVFITDKGLHVWNADQSFEDEDNMYIGVFNLIENEKFQNKDN